MFTFSLEGCSVPRLYHLVSQSWCVAASVKGKVIWITGASSGLGEEMTYILADHKAKLVLSGTREDSLLKVRENCLKKGLAEEDVLVLPFNIADCSVHENCVQKVLEHFKKIDVLVNNAGRSQRAKFQDIEPEVDRELFDVNVFGPVNLTRKVLPHFLEKNEGHVVVTSSITGKLAGESSHRTVVCCAGFPGSATYTGSKHALHGYFETLRSELSHRNIKVTLVCPGPAFSKIVERAFTGETGKVHGEKQKPTDLRLTTERCSQLMVVALVNQVDEAWMSLQPLLLLYYLSQYLPSFFR
ncbi:DHRS7, partial [Cordylochernes scorpioides]